MPDVDLLLKPREAAAALGVSYPTLKQWILAGTIKTHQDPRRSPPDTPERTPSAHQIQTHSCDQNLA